MFKKNVFYLIVLLLSDPKVDNLIFQPLVKPVRNWSLADQGNVVQLDWHEWTGRGTIRLSTLMHLTLIVYRLGLENLMKHHHR